jgi:hypothetical protein
MPQTVADPQPTAGQNPTHQNPMHQERGNLGRGTATNAATRTTRQTPRQPQPLPRSSLRRPHPLRLPLRCPGDPGKAPLPHAWGRSTGPRTAEGRARVAAARTIHGRYGAKARAHDRFILGFARYGRVYRAALRCRDHLPPDFAAQLQQDPLVLVPPPYPTGGLTAAEDRATQRAEAEALAPWKRAIAFARNVKRRIMAVQAEAGAVAPPAAAEAHAPAQDAATAAQLPGAGGSDVATAGAEAHAPEPARPAVPRTLHRLPRAQAEAHAPVAPLWAAPHAQSASAPIATVGAAAKPRAPEHSRSPEYHRSARNHAASFPPPAASRAATPVHARPHAPEHTTEHTTASPGPAAAIHPGALMRPSVRQQLQTSSLFDCLPTITRLASYSNPVLTRDATPRQPPPPCLVVRP